MENQSYQKIYDDFVGSYKKNFVDGEDIGVVIMRLVQGFASTNINLTVFESALAKKHEEIVNSTDANDKPIAVSKADIMVAATDEARDVRRAKAELKNLEHMINALKSLQKGVLNEYSHMGAA